jgi:Transmembrane domain of unknown function (DUF3566)
MSTAPVPRPGLGGPVAQRSGPRKVRLTVARVDPWSALKLSFLLSVALGIGLVVASIVLWEVLNGMGVFSQINDMMAKVSGPGATSVDVYQYVGLNKVVALSTFVGVLNVLIIMALSTLGAILYNLAGGLVGGLQVTLSDD